MEIPSLLAGYYYPTRNAYRCPKFHMCTVTKKCQNYDRHDLACTICETRTNASELSPDSAPLGGHLPEGEFYPDLQDAIGQLERRMNKSFAHPDVESQKFNPVDIARQQDKEHKIVEMIRTFSSVGKMRMEEEIMHAMLDEETRKILGRIM